MSTVQKVGKYKKMIRSSRNAPINKGTRPAKVERARKRHLKNARRSNGEAFAINLKKYYLSIPVPDKKVSG